MVRKLFRQMSVVQILSSVTVMACLLIDSAVIGRLLGSDALTACGLANPLLIVCAAVGNLLVCGVQVVFGKHMGRGDKEGMNACFVSAAALALGVSAAEMLPVLAGGRSLCALLGASPAGEGNPVFVMTGDYLRGYILGAPFFLLYQIMIPCLQMLGRRRLVLCSVAVMTGTNTAFDFLGVYVFRTGMFGIGLATALGYLAGLLVLAAFLLKKDCPLRLSARGIRREEAKGILKGGSSMIVSDLSYVLNTYLYNRILLAIAGQRAVAAYSVMTTLTNLLFCIGLGTGAVTLTLSSVFYGDRDRASLLEVLREMTAFSLMLMGAAVLLTGVFAPGMAGLFVREDPETASIAVSGLRMLVLSLLPAILANGFRSYAQGIGRPGMAALIAVMRFLVPTVLLAFGFGRLFGLKGVWMGTVCGEGLTLLAIAAAAWHRHGRIAFSAGAFSFLDRDFGVSGENRLENAVKTTAEAAETSRRLYTFCLGKGLDRRTAMLIGLCAEEIAVNVITHGFSKDRRAHSVDLRLTLEGDRKVLRIRDDCANFDPVRYLELHRDEDPAAHIGLRMVMGMVKEADYVRSLGLNQLTLVL